MHVRHSGGPVLPLLFLIAVSVHRLLFRFDIVRADYLSSKNFG